MSLSNSRVTPTDDDDATTTAILLIAGHAFVEVVPNHLLWIGAEADVLGLDDADRLTLITGAAGAFAARGLVIPKSRFVIPTTETPH